MNSPEA